MPRLVWIITEFNVTVYKLRFNHVIPVSTTEISDTEAIRFLEPLNPIHCRLLCVSIRIACVKIKDV